MIRRGRWLACALAVALAHCTPLAVPAAPAPLSDEEARAFRTLARTQVVASAAVGEEGTPTEQGCAMRVLLDSEGARERFEALYAQPRAEARTYAVMGLCLSGSPRCREAREALRADTTRIASLSGCIASTTFPPMLVSRDGQSLGWYVGGRGCAPCYMRRI